MLWNGKVLVAGGGSDIADLYTPLMLGTPETWASTGNLLAPRTGHQATLLDDGRVLISGGNDSSGNLLASS